VKIASNEIFRRIWNGAEIMACLERQFWNGGNASSLFGTEKNHQIFYAKSAVFSFFEHFSMIYLFSSGSEAQAHY
jgi:hypothetical protein